MGGAELTIVWIKTVASVHVRNEEKQKQLLMIFICTHYLNKVPTIGCMAVTRDRWTNSPSLLAAIGVLYITKLCGIFRQKVVKPEIGANQPNNIHLESASLAWE